MSSFKNIINAVKAKFGIEIDENAEPQTIAEAINNAKGIPEITAELQTGFDTQIAAVKSENETTVSTLKANYETQLETAKGELTKVAKETKESETSTVKAISDMKTEMEKMRTDFGTQMNALKGGRETKENDIDIPDGKPKGKTVLKTNWTVDNVINNMPLTTN